MIILYLILEYTNQLLAIVSYSIPMEYLEKIRLSIDFFTGLGKNSSAPQFFASYLELLLV